MKTVRFVLSRHPLDPNGGGGTQIARLAMEAAAESASVSCTALTSLNLKAPWPIDCVPKPPVRPVRVALRSVVDRRSLIHTRFRIGALTDVLKRATEDKLAAHHAYMAESVHDAIGDETRQRLAINLIVSESTLLRNGQRLRHLRSIEANRTFRDELRCLASADAVAGFDQDESALYERDGVPTPHLLRPCFAPASGPTHGAPPQLLFLADRTWMPNFVGLEIFFRLWGQIKKRSADAQLLVVGAGPVPDGADQDGIQVLGYVESLEAMWAQVRALAAPLTLGGGVRVKILDAAAHGVAVVATPAAVGSIDRYLPVVPTASDAHFVDRCVAILNDASLADREAATLYEANAVWWKSGQFQQDVCDWLDLG